MRIKKSIILNKYLILQIIFVIFYAFPLSHIYAQGFSDFWTTNTVTSLASSEHKPQSKTWYYGGYWWAVIPVAAAGGDAAGTYLWRLDGTNWTKLMMLSSDTERYADTKVIGNVTHIILQHTIGLSPRNAILVSIQFVSGSPPTYQFWSSRPGSVTISLDYGLEVATIDIDSNGRMWLASDDAADINVRWSDSPYSAWNGPTTLGSFSSDDICAVTAFEGNKIGVLWSNQSAEKYYFRYHIDGNNANSWSSPEVAASGSFGDGVADNHINFAVSDDGTIYAAVKTSYDNLNYPTIALLEREPNSSWNFYGVQNGNGTRPIALLDDDDDEIFVVYQKYNGGGEIVYKYSSTSSINFSSAEISLNPTAPDGQDVTSTKQNFTSEVLILFVKDHTTPDEWLGVLAGTEPLPVELSLFDAIVLEDKVILNWRTETEVSNYGFDIERLVASSGWEKLGFVEGNGNSNSPKDYSFVDINIDRSGQYNYRLKQIDNDGQFEYSNIISINVGVPANFHLSQNYPNPFNPSTKIDYSIPQASKVNLKIYDILGREVALLVDEYKETGTYTITFDASNLSGGIYFYTIAAGNFMETKKMSLVK